MQERPWTKEERILRGVFRGILARFDASAICTRANTVALLSFEEKTIEAHRELKNVYRDVGLSETTCRDLFRFFKDGDF